MRLLGIKRPAPKTRIGRIRRRLERLLLALMLLYVALQAYPQVLFANRITASDITIYSRSALPPESGKRLGEIAALVSRSELSVLGRHERIFLCNSPWLYRLFGPTSRGTFGHAILWTDNVFVADADVAGNIACRDTAEFNTRNFNSVAAHEITHGLIHHRLGMIGALRLPDWIAEGYCDYIAGEGSFPDSAGLRLLASGGSDSSSAFRYFTYRRMVKHLIDDGGLSFQGVVARGSDYDKVREETIEAIRVKLVN